MGRREGDDPIDAFAAAMPELAQPADGLQPAEDLLDQLPLPLEWQFATDTISGRKWLSRRARA